MNKDTLTTLLGLGQGIAVAVIDFLATTPEAEGSRWSNPVFWVGLGVAVLVAVKAYFTKGIDTKPTA